MYPFIVADIGGTNARFSVASGAQGQAFQFEHTHILKGKDYARIQDALSAYLAKLPSGLSPKGLSAAIAGPVLGDSVRMTNLDWGFSCQALARDMGFEQVVALNDFAAVAAAIPLMQGADLITLRDGKPQAGANKAVFGPGTGLGVAGIIAHQSRFLPNPCEGGHVNLAPTNAYEADILKCAMARLGHVSAEAFLSGPGLVNLYRAICDLEGVSADTLTPAEVSQAAIDGSQRQCEQALTLFCAFLGSFAGNLALTYGAQGGIYVAGGVVPRFVDKVLQSPFAERFAAKGPMQHYLEPIPVYLVTHPELAFTGAASWYLGR